MITSKSILFWKQRVLISLIFEVSLLLDNDPECAEACLRWWTIDNRCCSTNHVSCFEKVYINVSFHVTIQQFWQFLCTSSLTPLQSEVTKDVTQSRETERLV
jgi:hypothetical protein